MNEIKLVKAPEIAHKLQEVGANVTARLADLNIESQVATVDTVKSLKALRAELNKELAEFESQRKTLKSAILNPYDEFEALYKVEISTKYSNAIELLREKINGVELHLKQEKRNILFDYFRELCSVEKIDFVSFEQLNLKVDLSTSEKKLKEEINAFVTKVQDDLKLIETQKAKSEILVEYKKTLNASAAITAVTERQEAIKQEAERQRLERIKNREQALKAIGMTFDEVTMSYIFNDDIFISLIDVQELEKGQFTARYNELKQDIAKANVENQVIEQPKQTAPVLDAPKLVSTSEPIIAARIEIQGTREKMIALSNYLKQNGYIYKNI